MNKKLIKNYNEFNDFRGIIKIFKNIKSFELKQLNYSESKRYVIRGMHYQKKNLINKIIYVTHGKILDVLVNIKTKQVSYYLLDHKNPMLFIPKDFAHGFQVLSDKVKMIYLFDGNYEKVNSIGFNAFDKDLKIKWNKSRKSILSKEDQLLGSFEFFLEKI